MKIGDIAILTGLTVGMVSLGIAFGFFSGKSVQSKIDKRIYSPKSAVVRDINGDNYQDIIITSPDGARRVLFGTEKQGEFLSYEELKRRRHEETKLRYAITTKTPAPIPTQENR